MSLLEAAYRKYTEPVGEIKPVDVRLSPAEDSTVQSVDLLAKKLLRESRDELQRIAEDDWQEVSADPARLIAFASLEATRQIRASGSIPDTYTATTFCNGCRAEVPIFPGVPDKVNACPWCMCGQTPPEVSASGIGV